MKITEKNQTTTSVTLVIELDEQDQRPAKEKVLRALGKNVKIDGFRVGKAPLSAIAKAVDQNQLANEFLNEIVPVAVGKALDDKKLSTVIPPSVNVTKFVPFSELELEVLAEFLGEIKLADYRKLHKTKPEVSVDPQEVETVLQRIQFDMAERKDVDRASKKGDQVWIDFEGVDTNGEPVSGAKGEDYPLALGSNTFIPGFEDNLIGLKTGDTKEFALTFPKDYGVKALQSKKVVFKCLVKRVQQVETPKITDEIAQKIGPYKTVTDLKTDIKKQVKADKLHKAELEIESEIMSELADKTEIEMPEGMINEQIERMLADHKANLSYRAQDYADWLESEKLDEESHKKQIRPEAVKRLKGGVILSEIARKEGIELSEKEIDDAVANYKQQYASDPKMQAELAKPAARRDVAARILTDRTLTKLKELVFKQ